jgi:hypothetical protein
MVEDFVMGHMVYLNIPYVHSYERIRKNEKSQLEITSNARKV